MLLGAYSISLNVFLTIPKRVKNQCEMNNSVTIKYQFYVEKYLTDSRESLCILQCESTKKGKSVPRSWLCDSIWVQPVYLGCDLRKNSSGGSNWDRIEEANDYSLASKSALRTTEHNPASEFFEQLKKIHLSYPTWGARELEYVHQALIDSQVLSIIYHRLLPLR